MSVERVLRSGVGDRVTISKKTSAALYRIHVHINFRHFYTFLSLLRRTVSVSKLINRYDQDYMRDPDK